MRRDVARTVGFGPLIDDGPGVGKSLAPTRLIATRTLDAFARLCGLLVNKGLVTPGEIGAIVSAVKGRDKEVTPREGMGGEGRNRRRRAAVGRDRGLEEIPVETE